MIYSHHYYLRKQELHKLVAASKANGDNPPAPPKLVFSDHDKCFWLIKTKVGDKFMKTSIYNSDDSFVVHVDAEKFYQVWLESGLRFKNNRSCDCVRRQDMPNDYKYHYAIEGFKEGYSNPVPLADIGIFELNGIDTIGFTNGVTRTFYLISNFAESFPILVRGKKYAEKMFQMIGVGHGPILISELMGMCQCFRCTTVPSKGS